MPTINNKLVISSKAVNIPQVKVLIVRSTQITCGVVGLKLGLLEIKTLRRSGWITKDCSARLVQAEDRKFAIFWILLMMPRLNLHTAPSSAHCGFAILHPFTTRPLHLRSFFWPRWRDIFSEIVLLAVSTWLGASQKPEPFSACWHSSSWQVLCVGTRRRVT